MNVRPGASVVGIEEHEVDAVVVGSGGGGAPAALELAEAGLDVMVLEAGPYLLPEDFSQRPLDSVRRAYVDKGGQETRDGGVQILQGSCVGGSTVVNGEVCFRIPDAVLDEWAKDFGAEGLGPDDLGPVFDEVLERIGATDDDGRHAGGAKLTAPGFAKLGLEPKPVVRNVRGCRGCNYCFFGCAYGCKQSVDRSYLPAGVDAGATLVSDARVETIELDGARARGVVARTPHGTLKVRARAVVLACGAIATPLMLQDHGLGGAEVGENLAVHPISGPFGWYDEVQPPGSAMIGVYSDAYRSEGFLLETFSAPPDFLAALVPGFGAKHRALVRDMARLGGVASIVRDTGGLGRVGRDRAGKKRIEWTMDAPTEHKIRQGIRRVCEIHFAAGARKVTLPALDIVELRPDDGLDAIDRLPLRAPDTSFLSYHPQGTARIGAVTDSSGEVRGTPGLFVMDTSLFPSPVGVNTQVPVMAVATLLARRLAERLAG